MTADVKRDWPRSSPASARTPTFTGLVILFSAALPGLAFVGLSPILPTLSAHFAAQANASLVVRLLVTIVGPTIILGAPLAGYFATRFGERRIILIAAVLYGASGSLAAVLDNLYAMLATRIVLGFALAAVGTLAISILAKLYADQARNRWLGYYSMTGSFITLLLIPLCGFLGSIDYRLVFLTHALALPLAAAFFIALPRNARLGADAVTDRRSKSTPFSRPPIPWALIALGMACGTVCTSSTLYLPFHFAAMGVVGASKIGMLLLPATLTSALGALAYGKVRTILSSSGAFVLAFSLIALGLCLAGIVPRVEVAVASMAIMGFGSGMITPNMFAIAAQMGSDVDRSHYLGFAKGAFYAGPLASQAILEPVARYESAAAAILFVGIFAAGLALWQLRGLSSNLHRVAA